MSSNYNFLLLGSLDYSYRYYTAEYEKEASRTDDLDYLREEMKHNLLETLSNRFVTEAWAHQTLSAVKVMANKDKSTKHEVKWLPEAICMHIIVTYL